MKRGIIFLAAMVCLALGAGAQGLGTVFNQKQTQKKYLLQQIAALQVYIGYVKDGYKIAKDGLGFIGDMKNGEFSLHKDYFASLKKVKPEISGYYKVEDIKELHQKILSVSAKDKSVLDKDGMLDAKELKYINSVFAKLFADCSRILDELEAVTTNDKLEMSDDQRIKRIDELFAQMQDNYTFCVAFGNEAKVLSAARQQEINDLKTSRSANGLSN